MPAKRPRLSRSSDFQRIYRQGSSTASRFLVLYWFRRPAEGGSDGPRLGLSVSKKMGGAVVRNRVKRLLREAFQGCAGQLAEEYDLVVIARPQLLELVAREGEGEKGVVGAAVIIGLENIVSSYTERWSMVLGLLFVLTMIFAPEGIVGKLRSLRRGAKK